MSLSPGAKEDLIKIADFPDGLIRQFAGQVSDHDRAMVPGRAVKPPEQRAGLGSVIVCRDWQCSTHGPSLLQPSCRGSRQSGPRDNDDGDGYQCVQRDEQATGPTAARLGEKRHDGHDPVTHVAGGVEQDGQQQAAPGAVVDPGEEDSQLRPAVTWPGPAPNRGQGS